MLLRFFARSGGGGGGVVGGGRWRSLSTVLMYPQQTVDIADMSSMSTPQPANAVPPAAANPVPPSPLFLQGVILYSIIF